MDYVVVATFGVSKKKKEINFYKRAPSIMLQFLQFALEEFFRSL